MARGASQPIYGINPNARAFGGWLGPLAARFVTGEPCPYPDHRETDWRLVSGGPVACGVCHPPARGLDVERVA